MANELKIKLHKSVGDEKDYYLYYKNHYIGMVSGVKVTTKPIRLEVTHAYVSLWLDEWELEEKTEATI